MLGDLSRQTLTSPGRRLSQLALQDPARHALVIASVDGPDEYVAIAELEVRSNQTARLLAEHGELRGRVIGLAVGNTADFVVCAFAIWKLGATVLPLSPRAPAGERNEMLRLADAALAVGDWDNATVTTVSRQDLAGARWNDLGPLPDVLSDPGRIQGTGGSTGRPKLVVAPGPFVHVDQLLEQSMFGQLGLRNGQSQLVAGPLYHGFGFDWAFRGLLHEHTVILLDRFDADLAVSVIERHNVQYVGLVPTMMHRILQLPDLDRRDLSSVEVVMHTAAACPAAVKRAWIDLVGPTKVFEGYGGSEGFGNTVIRGDEWLAHPGSIGLPVDGCEVIVLNELGEALPPGEIGDLYLRRNGDTVEQPYVGAPPPPRRDDGFATFGDLGWLDVDGYVHIVDRRTDMIVTGGVNVYPAEVEAVLLEDPSVADAAVIGIPDQEWGRRVHAIVELVEDELGQASVAGHQDQVVARIGQSCRERLSGPQVPKTIEVVDRLPRDDAGKIRRNALASERT